MKSSTSQRAGSSRTFLKTMYFTSGAYVMTRRLRTCRSPVALYSRHSARASSEEMRFRLRGACGLHEREWLLRGGRTDGQRLYRALTRLPPSPIWGIRLRSARRPTRGPRPPRSTSPPEPPAQRELGERRGQLRVLVDGHARLACAARESFRPHAPARGDHLRRAVAGVAQRRGDVGAQAYRSSGSRRGRTLDRRRRVRRPPSWRADARRRRSASGVRTARRGRHFGQDASPRSSSRRSSRPSAGESNASETVAGSPSAPRRRRAAPPPPARGAAAPAAARRPTTGAGAAAVRSAASRAPA